MEITTVLREEAFQAIEKGMPKRTTRMLLEEIDKLSGKVDSIVMAQLSMSALAPHLQTRVPVYDSGTTGFGRIRQMMGA